MRPVRGIAAPAVLAFLGGCHAAHENREPDPQWLIRSQLVFVAPDLVAERSRPPRDSLRLWFPYVSGDLYGSPTAGALVESVIDPHYRFEIDLNRSHEALLKSLEPTRFSLSWLRVDPQATRIARLLPFVLQRDGIDPVGSSDWIDAQSRQRLMLVYVDRPARISGSTRVQTRTIRYDVQVEHAGYVWIGQSQALGAASEVTVTYATVPRPASVVLAVAPTGS